MKNVILIVEDDLFNRMYLNELFEDAEYSVLEATNGTEAINLVKENPEIKLILMDIKMPVMNGDEALAYIKKIRLDLPVVALTGLAMEVEVAALFEKGFDTYLTKPVERNKLFEIINKYIN
jgi:CheY-like chemotaxis protein